MYDSLSVARRATNILPDECWKVQPSVYEDEDDVPTDHQPKRTVGGKVVVEDSGEAGNDECLERFGCLHDATLRERTLSKHEAAHFLRVCGWRASRPGSQRISQTSRLGATGSFHHCNPLRTETVRAPPLASSLSPMFAV